MQARPMWKKEVKLDKREKALAAHWLYRQIKVVVMNIHRRCLRGLGKWLLVNQHLFSLIGKHQSCPVLRGGRLRSQLWRDYYWHETSIWVSVPLVRLTGLDALGTQLTRLFPSNHRSHRPLRHRTWSHVADCQICLQSAPYQACLFSMAAWLGGALLRARQRTGLVILISATIASSPNCWSAGKAQPLCLITFNKPFQ